MTFQTGSIDPATTTPAADIGKIKNDLSVLKSVIGGVPDVDVPSMMVGKTSDTGSAILPAGTTAQRDVTPQAGYLRYNATLDAFEGYKTAGWGSIGGGATGSGGDQVFYENDTVVNNDHTITRNSSMVGPLEVATGKTLTIATGKRLVIL